MKRYLSWIILLVFCALLCSCETSSDIVETTIPTEAIVETTPAELPRLTKDEMLALAIQMDVEEISNDSLNGLIGNVYTFDGVIESIQADHAIVSLSPADATAEVYLSPDELSSVVVKQKVTFVGRVDEVNADGIICYSTAIARDRFKYYGEIVDLNPEYAPNTYNLKFSSTDLRTVTFTCSLEAYVGEYHYYSYKEIDGRYVDAYLMGKNGEMITYDPYLLNFPEIIEMSQPEFTMGEIQDMIALGLTLDEVAAKISTLADVVQYLNQKGFVYEGGDIHFRYGVCTWSVNKSAQIAFDENAGNCGSGSNLVNYILRGDFEEQGYFKLGWNAMGHIINYFKQNGQYYLFDHTYVTNEYYAIPNGSAISVTDDMQQFADQYIESNNVKFKFESPEHIVYLGMYAYEDNHLPGGYGNIQQSGYAKGWPRTYYHPKQYEDMIHILYWDKESVDIIYVDAPDKSIWPEKAR